MNSHQMDICKEPAAVLHPDFRRLCNAATLLNAKLSESDSLSTYALSTLFSNPYLPTLTIYRAASCLREGQLKEIVQFLIFEGPPAASAIVRLLSIMQGLPGNWELVMEFLEQQATHFAHFDQRVVTLIALLGGRKTHALCDWKPVVERANENMEARFALCAMAEMEWRGKIDPVLTVHQWQSELKHEPNASVWRELQWAKYARSLSVNGGLSLTTSHNRNMTNQSAFYQQPSDFDYRCAPEHCRAIRQYVRVCGHLLRKRSFKVTTTGEAVLDGEHVGLESGEQQSVIVTPSLRKSLAQMAQYLSFGMSFVLEGPTGCGKTTLISLLARNTVCDNEKPEHDSEVPGVTFIQMDSAMTDLEGGSLASLVGGIVPLPDGGGFRWRPGPIGNAVERGEWIVFENIGKGTGSKSSSVPILQLLSRAKPGDKLDAPGRGQPITVGRGFRCIATRTVLEDSRDEEWEPPGSWDSWCRISMDGLSHEENVGILKNRYAKIYDCIERIVKCVSETAKYAAACRGPLFRVPTLRDAVRICERVDNSRNQDSNLTIENAFLESMDVLAGWCAKEDHLSNLLSIIASSWSLNDSAASDLYFNHKPDLVETEIVIGIGRARMSRTGIVERRNNCKLSQTGHTLRLLERILRCLQVKENVLLLGEAGSGKTSVIQELASLLTKKLVVVNLSRQTELSDLIGGFRPVQLDAAVPTLAKKFEALFCKCMSKQKNIRFLEALQQASRSSMSHKRALRLMTGAMKAVPGETRRQNSDVQEGWASIAKDLEHLQISLSPSPQVEDPEAAISKAHPRKRSGEPVRKRPRVASSLVDTDSQNESPEKRTIHTTGTGYGGTKAKSRVEFSFVEGVLVQAIRNGHWILLDEVNLAPPELLERLVSVVDRGRVTLADESSEVVVQRPGFRLFAAMNPPTDVGKRPLPNVLRSRFTEFHVGDMVDENDVLLFTMGRFFQVRSTQEILSLPRGEKDVAQSVASFYLKCWSLAKAGTIADSTGKPVRFSLRSLSRMLDFAAGLKRFMTRGLLGIKRALFEGALVAFATQLPRNSREHIVLLAKGMLLEASKGSRYHIRNLVDSVSIPAEMKNMVRVLQGFPVPSKLGSRVNLDEKSTFVISPTVENTLSDVCRALVFGAPQLPILLQGPTAAGKTSLITHLALVTGNELVRINNHEHTEITEYIGGYIATPGGSLVFSEGPLVRAARRGEWVLLDELNLAPPDVLESLNRLLDDNREIFIPDTGEIVKAAAGFRLFATQNPPGLYGGRKELSRAFRSRFVEVHVDDLPDEDLRVILERKASIPQSFAKKMILVLRDLQMRRRSTGLFSGKEGFATARDLFRWAARQPRSREELAMHGFFLLGERSRNALERDTVREILSKTIGVGIDLLNEGNLYQLEKSSDSAGAAYECLEFSLQKLGVTRVSLMQALVKRRIVPTPGMRRMMILLLHCVANKEPALLVGATGGGKTSVCSVISEALSKALLSVNCHRHTEASDILGAFRPGRRRKDGDPLFVWADGPLVQAMKGGDMLLADEINMADDAVIERLNSVLELERTLLLSEKGTSASDFKPETVIAHPSFQIFATMNPGGDFGKKELSPALRNRFTELWILPPSGVEDFVPIVNARLFPAMNTIPDILRQVSETIVKFLGCYFTPLKKATLGREKGSRYTVNSSFLISARDVSAWCDFVAEATNAGLNPFLAVAHGARLILLDGISVGSTSGNDKELELSMWRELVSLIPPDISATAEAARYMEGQTISLERLDTSEGNACLKVDCFHIMSRRESPKVAKKHHKLSSFSFDAANVTRNVARLARGLVTSSRPILLEGPPGSGKSSLIAALAQESSHDFVRVNLSESTEMSDLVGSDAPGESRGEFSFRDGPLLQAMRNGSWLLLDELNLASQSVLEGLNSVLDHRKSVFIPELNKEAIASPSFRVYGAQNPAIEGGGRRGLPKSFLNRFTRVQIETPTRDDIFCIARALHPTVSEDTVSKVVDLLDELRIVMKSNGRDVGSFGLRDALRWCDLLAGVGSGVLAPTKQLSFASFPQHIGITYDVVILQSLRTGEERNIAEKCFESVFGYSWRHKNDLPSIQKNRLLGCRIGLTGVHKLDNGCETDSISSAERLILSSRTRELQALSFAVNAGWPALFFSSATSLSREEGRRLVQNIAALSGKRLRVIFGGSLGDGDSFVGGYEQQDLARSVRLTFAKATEIVYRMLHGMNDMDTTNGGTRIQSTYAYYQELGAMCSSVSQGSVNPLEVSEIIRLSRCIADSFGRFSANDGVLKSLLSSMSDDRKELEQQLQRQETGQYASFQWRKSDLVRAIEEGEWIYIQDADMCPPAILDRLNPLFERPPIAVGTTTAMDNTAGKVILAEAPCREDGMAVYMHPHPDFRIFFSISRPMTNVQNCGLSRALLDRSLRIFINEEISLLDQHSISGSVGLYRSLSLEKTANSIASPCMDNVVSAIRDRVTNGCNRGEKKLMETDSDPSIMCEGITTSGGLFMDSTTCLIDRDVKSLRYLEGTSSETMQNEYSDLWENMTRFSSFVEHDDKEIWNNSVACESMAREAMMRNALFSYVLSAFSIEEVKMRLRILLDRHVASPSFDYKRLYEKAAAQVESLLSRPLIKTHHRLCPRIDLQHNTPLDPVFGLDVSATTAVIAAIPACHVCNCLYEGAIWYRMELLCLAPLRIAWKEAQQSAHTQTKFSQAKMLYDLKTRNGGNSQNEPASLEEIAYKVVFTIITEMDLIGNHIAKRNTFTSRIEVKWTRFFETTTALCTGLAIQGDHGCYLLPALLGRFLTLLQHLKQIGELKCVESLSGLLLSLNKHIGYLGETLENRGAVLMPRTRISQDIESGTLLQLEVRKRETLSFSEIDAVAKLLSSVCITPISEESELSQTLRRVGSSLQKGGNSLLPTIKMPPLAHWMRLSLEVALNLVQETVNRLTDEAFLESDCPLKALSVALKASAQLKCIPLIELSTVVAVQKLAWVLESNCKIKPNAQSHSLQKAVSKYLLAQKASLAVQSITSRGSDQRENQPESSFNLVLKQAHDASLASFWNIEQARNQALASVTLVASGAHHHFDVDHRKYALMVPALVSALFGDSTLPVHQSYSSLLDIVTSQAHDIPGGSVQGITKLRFDALSCVRRALELCDSEKTNTAEQVTKEVLWTGIAWVAIGLLRVRTHHEEVQSRKGIDPSHLALKMSSLAYKTAVEAKSATRAYHVVRRNRLGGDDVHSAAPLQHLSEKLGDAEDVIRQASLQIVYRPSSGLPFSAYENLVDSTSEKLISSMDEGGVLGRLVTSEVMEQLEQIAPEALHLYRACGAAADSLEDGGSFFHFRDLSVDFGLGLREIQFGLSQCLRASERQKVTLDQNLTKKIEFFMDMLCFPRLASSSSLSICDLVQKCIETTSNGPLTQALADLLLTDATIRNEASPKEVTDMLSSIVSSWKMISVSTEEIEKKKSSLHILREASRQEDMPANDVLNKLEFTEENDFLETFNPMDQDFEERFLGVSTVTESQKIETVASGNLSLEVDKDVPRMDPELFWSLYCALYCHRTEIGNNQPFSISKDKRRNCLESLSALLHPIFEGIESVSDDVSSIWELFGSLYVSKQFGNITEDKNESTSSWNEYNFYKDPNPLEIQRASASLQVLLKSIARVQGNIFAETGAHPVLHEVAVSIERVAALCKMDTPISRVVVGVENVLRKADEWHRLFATRPARLDEDVLSLSRLVASWRSLEMKSWTLLLDQRIKRQEARACRWIFFLYDAVVEDAVQGHDRTTENVRNVVSTLDQFMRSSPSGEFLRRNEMLESIANHLLTLRDFRPSYCVQLSQSIYSLHQYYRLFENAVQKQITDGRALVQKELSEFSKLVSWNAAEDLGSSEKMFKQKDKYLEYYRLKMSGEKTRRKLHKLCLKIDAIVKKPVYECLRREIMNIGFKKQLPEHKSQQNMIPEELRWSNKMKTILDNLIQKGHDSWKTASAEGIVFDKYVSTHRISRIDSFSQKIVRFGEFVCSGTHQECNQATYFSKGLRDAMRDRLNHLRNPEKHDIQLKQRALIELFQCLRKSGVSPFEKSVDQESNHWLSTPNPGLSPEYDAIANELYFSNAQCLQRLREVSDSRIRSRDINQDDASRARAFCQNLFDNAGLERQAINAIISETERLSNHAQWLLDFNPEYLGLTAIQKWDQASAEKLIRAFGRLESIVVDIDVCRDAVKSSTRWSKPFGLPAPRWQGDPVAMLHEFHSTSLQHPLTVTMETLDATSCAIRQALESNMISLRSRPDRVLHESVTGALHKTCEAGKDSILKLTSELELTLTKAERSAPSCISVAILRRTIRYLRYSLNVIQHRNVEGFLSQSKKVSDLHKVAEIIIERVLISSQQIVSWNDMDLHQVDIPQAQSPENLNFQDISALKPNILKKAHNKIRFLGKAANVKEISNLLSQNQEILQSLAGESTTEEQRRHFLYLQYKLGTLVAILVANLLAPSLRKAAQFHCEAQKLLRSLSRIFVGVCSEGFCRPPEGEADEQEEGEQATEGAGFGDAGDGDMSGAKNVSDEIEDEEQLLGLNDEEANQEQVPEEGEEDSGFEMTADFDGQMQDVQKDQQNEKEEDGDEMEADKQMAPEGGFGESVVDERLWNDSDQPESAEGGAQDESGEKHEEELDGNGITDLVAREEENSNEGKQPKDHRDMAKSEDIQDKDDDAAAVDGDDDAAVDGDDEKETPLDHGKAKKKKSDAQDNEEYGMDEQDENDSSEGNQQERVPEIQDIADKSAEAQNGRENDVQDPDREVENNHSQDSRGDVAENELRDGEEMHKDDEAMVGVSIEECDEKDLDTENNEEDGDTKSANNVPEDLHLDGEAEDQSDYGDGNEDDDTSRTPNGRKNVEDANTDEKKPDDIMEPEGNNIKRSESIENNVSREEKAEIINENGAVGTEQLMQLEGGRATTNMNSDQNNEKGQAAFVDPNARGPSAPDHASQPDIPEASKAAHGPNATGEDLGTESNEAEGAFQDTHGDNGSSDTQKGRTLDDPNPLRTTDAEAIVKIWEKYLDMLQNNDTSPDQMDSSPNMNKNGTKWEFQKNGEGSKEDIHALGAATDEQHHAMPQPEEDIMDVDLKEIKLNEPETSPEFIQKGNSAVVSKNKEEYENRPIDPECDNQEMAEGGDFAAQIATKPHPARNALESAGFTEDINSPRENCIGKNVQEHQDGMECKDHKDHSEPETVGVAPDVKLSWVLEELKGGDAASIWRQLESRVSSGASILCEQLRLVLEPTVASSLAGGYRTGKRLNMRKVIEYVASDFQKDRIWLRRTRKDKRSYDVLVAIDDSASMVEGAAGAMAIESLALVLSALSRLEIGRVGVARFGAEAEMVRGMDESFPMSVESGGQLLQKFTFSQSETNVAGLLQFVSSQMIIKERGSDREHISLVFVISDGRLSSRPEVERQIRMLKDQNILVAFLIVDQQRQDEASIFEVRKVEYSQDGSVSILPYMQNFPVEFYTVVQNIQSLPMLLADALRQWVEMTSTWT